MEIAEGISTTTTESQVAQERQLVYLSDLLTALEDNPNLPMLRSTVAKFSEFLGDTCDKVTIEALETDRIDFRDYLRNRKYSKNSVRSYGNYLNILLARARDLGWRPEKPVIPAEWEPVFELKMHNSMRPLIRFLIKQGLSPSTVEERHLSDWIDKRVHNGGAYSNASAGANSLRKLLVEHNFNSRLSKKRVMKGNYAVPIEEFPAALREEMEDLLRWKLDRFITTRPANAQIRPVTAKKLVHTLCRLYGFAVNIRHVPNVNSLRDLITESIVGKYLEWAFGTRKCKSNGLIGSFGSVYAALAHNPNYADMQLSWLPAVLQTLPEDSEEEALRRKEEKYLPYDKLRSIPEQIRGERAGLFKAGQREIALSLRNELVVEWMITLPWRQRNLRECRIAGDNPNLAKMRVPSLSSITKPDWLADLEKQKPEIEVWQFRFTKDETKTHHDVHCVLPKRLIDLLERYLEYRKYLLSGPDPGTLFLNDKCTAYNQHTFAFLVSTLTLRYGGRRVTPHLFRDIFAYMWLEKMPEDYLTLSKLLWHRNINTTIRIYGRRCNESTALCRMERVLGL